jgi:hypothetical protein
MKNKVIETIANITDDVIKQTNELINSPAWFKLFGLSLEDMVGGSDQQTQDTTKLIQYIINNQIVKLLGEDGYKDETTGRDYMIHNLPIEFKLMGGNDKSSFATGNKISATAGAKTNLVWCIKYKMEDGQIISYASALVDTDLVEDAWNAGSGTKDSYSTLRVTKTESDAVDVVHGKLNPASKYLQLLTTPVINLSV